MSSSGQTQSGLRAGSLGLAGVVVLSAVLMGPAISLFFNTPVMAGNAGASVPLVFVLALVGIMLSASSVAQFARKISSAGSFYGFIERAAGKQFGFMARWSTFGAYLGAAVGARRSPVPSSPACLTRICTSTSPGTCSRSRSRRS